MTSTEAALAETATDMQLLLGAWPEKDAVRIYDRQCMYSHILDGADEMTSRGNAELVARHTIWRDGLLHGSSLQESLPVTTFGGPNGGQKL